jgi:hypothetical protein
MDKVNITFIAELIPPFQRVHMKIKRKLTFFSNRAIMQMPNERQFDFSFDFNRSIGVSWAQTKKGASS